MASLQQLSEIRDGMRIDWNVPIAMDDGLRAARRCFSPGERRPLSGPAHLRPLRQEPRLPGRLSERLAAHGGTTSRRHRRLQQPLPELGSGRSGKMGAARLCLRARRFARRRLLARLHRSFLAARNQGFLRLHRMGRRAAMVERQGRAQRHFLLRHEPVACRLAAAAASCRHVHLGRLGRLVSRHDASRRHPLDVLGELVRHAGQDRAIRPRRARRAQPRAWRAGVRTGDAVGRSSSPKTAPISAARSSRIRSTTNITATARRCGRRSTTPLFSAANWGGQGLHPRGNFEGFVRAASKQKWLEAHGIEHWTHFYTDYGREQQLRFFDYFLHGKKDGWSKQPKVLLQVRHPGEKFVARAENEWPIKRTQWTKFYLDPAEHGAATKKPSGSAKLAFEAMGDGLTFLTPVLEHDTEITGPSALKLFASSSTKDADFFIVLRVFTGDLKEVVFQGAIDPHTPIAQGWLRASHRKLDKKLSTALPALSHPRQEAAARPRASRSNSTSRSGRPRSRCRPAIASASRCAARTTNTAAPAAASCRTSRTS